MADQIEMPHEGTAPRGVGPQLRAAREKQGLTIEQVAAETRISQRHIASIESGDFNDLPGRTYATGFARNMAKVVGLDQNDVVAMVRAELDNSLPPQERRQTFEPGDPARAPSRGLVWLSIVAVILLLVGLFFAARVLFSPAAELPSLVEQEEAEQAERLAARQAAQEEEAEPIDETGEVVFTAQGPAWVRFYDDQNRVLAEMTMEEGDTYTVPADASGAQLLTGRPDLLEITIGGRRVAKLSNEMETLSDVPVTAEALLARNAPAPASTPTPGASPSASPQPAAQ